MCFELSFYHLYGICNVEFIKAERNRYNYLFAVIELSLRYDPLEPMRFKYNLSKIFLY